MKILMGHNYYQKAGGEDSCYESECELLANHGHKVYRYIKHNDDIKQMSMFDVGSKTLWNDETYHEILQLLQQEQIDIVHFHNTFPLISPSVYYAAEKASIPVIQTLHNYRLICSNGIFYRNGHICEDCIGKTIPWPSIIHACYRDSRLQTAGVASMQTLHRIKNTWKSKVTIYIALTQFGCDKFIEAGIDPAQIRIKPNFIPNDPGFNDFIGDYILFVGRLTPEKGVFTVLDAWRNLSHIPLKIAGDGPSYDQMKRLIQRDSLNHVEMLGWKKPSELVEIVKNARALVFTSKWYETFGLVAAEAFACGVPVIASRIGAIADVVSDNKDGIHFTPGSVEELRIAATQLWENNDLAHEMSRNARKSYEEKFSPGPNYKMLMSIYEEAIALKSSHS